MSDAIQPPVEKLIYRGEILFCLDCGAPLEMQESDDAGREICWITHEPGCPVQHGR